MLRASQLAEQLSALDGVEVLNTVHYTQVSLAFGDDVGTAVEAVSSALAEDIRPAREGTAAQLSPCPGSGRACAEGRPSRVRPARVLATQSDRARSPWWRGKDA